jgi:hypothetical protein
MASRKLFAQASQRPQLLFAPYSITILPICPIQENKPMDLLSARRKSIVYMNNEKPLNLIIHPNVIKPSDTDRFSSFRAYKSLLPDSNPRR